MPLPSTGDAALDFTLEAGPRAVTPDTPDHIIEAIGKYASLEPMREEMKRRKLARIARVNALVEQTSRENRILEELYQGTPSMLPYARIPPDLIKELEAENKEPWNPAMREDTLRCYPGLILNVKRGIHGQQYVNGRGR